MRRKHIGSNNEEVEVLCVPWFPQATESYYCLPYSIWMIIEYYRNVYGGESLKLNIPHLSVEEIAEICKTDKKTGTRIADELLRDLNNKIKPLNFVLKRGTGLEEIRSYLKKDCPCIVLYDCSYVIYDTGSSVGHAGVVIGINDNAIFLNNPWLGAEVGIDKIKFRDAWEIEFNSVIFVEPNPQKTLTDEDANQITH